MSRRRIFVTQTGRVERSDTHRLRGLRESVIIRLDRTIHAVAALGEPHPTSSLRDPFTIDAMVALPDHLHAVWTLPEGDTDFAIRWGLIKSGFSRVTVRREEEENLHRAALAS
jgi:REP element-mobilizing transposase RayT